MIFDPAADSSVPKGLSVSPNRDPLWTDDLEALFFGLYEPRHKDGADDTSDRWRTRRRRPGRKRARTPSAAATPAADDKVDLVLWHYKDPRLQTQQEVQEARDRAYNYVAVYRVQPKKFIRLADDGDAERDGESRSRAAGRFGTDDREYELMGSLDGRRHEDVFAIDLTTGARKLAVRHLRYFSGAVAGRLEVPLLRERRLPRLFARDRAGQEHHRRGCRSRSSTSKTITTTSSRRSTPSAGPATTARSC